MNQRLENLHAAVIEAAGNSSPPLIRDLETRPVFFLNACSTLGQMHAAAIAGKLKQAIAVIEDHHDEATIYGLPRWTCNDLLQRVSQFSDALLLDFSTSRTERAMARLLADASQAELKNCVPAQFEFGMHSVYESTHDYRNRTLERMDDFLALIPRFEDDWSRETLYANLLFRLTLNTDPLLQAWADPSEEYFSTFSHPQNFRLGTREHYVDCGAYQGPIIEKFLGATQGRYASITAFEPDGTNFETLQQRFNTPSLPNVKLINKAVSNRRQTLRFHETGTVSSHVSSEGNVLVNTTRLDDELEHLTFLKMDVEGFEPHTLQGAKNLLRTQRPRIASCVYHYAFDLLKVIDAIDTLAGDYHYRLRQHNGSYYYDLVLYASPQEGLEPIPSAV